MQPLRAALIGFGFIAERGHLPSCRCVELVGAAYRSASEGSREILLAPTDSVVHLQSRLPSNPVALSAATKR